MVLDHDRRIKVLEGQKSTVSKGSKKLSLKGYILSKNPKNDVQKTLCIGYYLESFDNMASFHAQDLEKGFRLAKEPVPPNINDKVNLNIKKGHLMEAEEKKENKKAWLVTNSGEKFIDSNFDNK